MNNLLRGVGWLGQTGLGRYLIALACIFLLTFALIGPVDDPFNFNDVDGHISAQTEGQGNETAENYLNAHFPPGTSILVAMATLTKAGAVCSFASDPDDPGSYFCDYTSRPSGLLGIFVQLDWAIWLYYTPDRQRIRRMHVDRGLTGP